MIKWICCLVVLLAVSIGYAEDPLKTFSASVDQPERGRQTVTVRMIPSATRTYDELLFEAVLGQRFMFKRADGSRKMRTFKPATFTYRDKNVRLVEDLEKYISFRVPVGQDEAKKAFGVKTFRDGVVIEILEIKIEAKFEGSTLWREKVKVDDEKETGAAK